MNWHGCIWFSHTNDHELIHEFVKNCELIIDNLPGKPQRGLIGVASH